VGIFFFNFTIYLEILTNWNCEEFLHDISKTSWWYKLVDREKLTYWCAFLLLNICNFLLLSKCENENKQTNI
jgi:hypothetical protein